MLRRPFLLTVAAALPALLARPARAQGGVPPAAAPPREASQFDFLLGAWELEVTPKVGGLAAALHGTPRLVGTWKAWRAFDGHGIEDELRIVDASGNPVTLAHALRLYDARSRRWSIAVADAYRGRIGQSVGQWQDGEMRTTGSGPSADGKPVVTRTRWHDIGPDRFRMRQDRSTDDGATWDEGVLAIAARRTAAKAPR
ncbi:MAG: hypothetical protein JNN18_07315 [Rubrivivax sp.]|nr:hypothetical protein [Rubrivivax sp.]